MAHVLVAVPIEKTVALILTHVVLSAPWLDQALGREDLMTARLKDIGSWHVWLTELVQDCHSCSQYQRLRRLREHTTFSSVLYPLTSSRLPAMSILPLCALAALSRSVFYCHP